MEGELAQLLHRLQELGMDLSDLDSGSGSDSDGDSDSGAPAHNDEDGDYLPESERTNERVKALIDLMMSNARRKLKPGDICVWEHGLQNRKWPSKNQPVVVIESLSEPIYDGDEHNSGSPYYREPLDVRVMGTDSKRVFFLDSRRLRKIDSCNDE